MKKYKVGKPSPVEKSTKVTRRLVATLINNGMKEIRNKTKSPELKKALQKIIDIREKQLKKMKEGKLTEGHKIVFSKDEMAKLHKDGKLEKDGHTYIFSEGKITEGKRIKLPSGIVIDIGMNYLKVYNYDGKEIPFDKNEVLKFIRASRQRMRLV